MANETLAEAKDIAKTFGATVALQRGSATFRAGEIHAVCGENGAGKSTLLKVIAGMVVPDSGQAVVRGTLLSPHTAKEAIDRGVAMVMQHFALVPVFSALENIMLGAEPVRAFGVLDAEAARTKARRIVKDLGADFAFDTPVEALGVGDRQRIEIARALYRDAKLLILDEPTAVLTKSEVALLYGTLRRLADAGTGIVVVTHKMDEVKDHADVVTVMRKGVVLFSRPMERGGDVTDITKAIMGEGGRTHAAEGTSGASRASSDDVVCALKDVVVGRGLRELSLTLHAGEIVGVAGVEGNGQRELVEVLAGDVAPDKGTLSGGPFAIVREDRQQEGLVLDAPLRDNITLGELGSFTRHGLVDLGALEKEAQARLDRSGAPKDLERAARTLSGGNQQKIVVERALARNAKALIASQPTRGVDLGAAGDIHARFREAAAAGTGILVISADLDELRALASRILVLARGRVVAEVAPSATDDEIGRLMLGGHA